MFAASQAFPLQDLARNQAATFRNQRAVLSFTRPAARVVAFVAGPAAARFVLHYAHRFAQQAVWFRGAADEVEELTLDREFDPRDSLRVSLDAMESDLVKIATGAQGFAANLRELDGNTRGQVRDAFDRLAKSALDLREEVRNFKGAMQAHDATVDAVRRPKGCATTPDTLQRDLERALN